jgi:hypothetical protein
MPLTPEEQAELNTLNERAGAVQGLTPAESVELQSLNQRAGMQLSQQALFRVAIEEGRRMRKARILGDPGPTAVRARTERNEAIQELRGMGVDPRQFEVAEGVTRKLESLPLGQIAGGIAGGIAGAATFGPDPSDIVTVPGVAGAVAKMFGASAGAGIGGGAGEAVQIGIEEGRAITRDEFLKSFVEEAAFEGGGRLAGKALKTIANPIIKQSIPEAAALVDEFAKFGGTFDPVELDKRFSLQAAKTLSQGGLGVPGVIEEFTKRRTGPALAMADSIVDSIAGGIARETPEQIGEILASDISRGGRVLNQLDDLFNPLYTKIDSLTGEATVSTSKLKSLAKSELAKDSRIKHLSAAGRSKAKDILDIEDVLTFSDMRGLGSSLAKETRRFGREADVSEAFIKRLSEATQDAIKSPESARGLSDEASRLLQNTNRLYAASRNGLETTLSEKLASRLAKNPSSVVREVFPKKNPKSIRLMKKSLVEPISGRRSLEGERLWNQLRQAWLADVIETASPEGVIRPTAIKSALNKLGSESAREMFSAQELKRINRVADIFEIVGKRQTGPNAISLARVGQAAGGISLVSGIGQGDFIKIGAGGALLLGPRAMAKFALSDAGSKLLVKGINIPRGSDRIIPIASRLVKLSRDIDKRRDRKREQAAAIRQRQRKQAQQVTPVGFRGIN